MLRLMEHSVNSPSAEESGWTSYLEDFSNTREPSSYFSVGGSSLLSDAASCAAWNLSRQNHLLSCSSLGQSASPNLPKKLSFKKTRTKQISEDDPLEDTASSPVNSPKVGELHQTEIISRKIDDQLDASTTEGKEFKASEHYSELQMIDDKQEINLKAKSTDCTDLKKRGFCLVPLSMLVNYFG